MAASSPSPSPPPVRAGEVFRAFLALGSTAFGGPIAHIGYLRRAFVLRRRWLDESRFAQLLAVCQFLPGPASSQLALAIGLQRDGGRGALQAFAGIPHFPVDPSWRIDARWQAFDVPRRLDLVTSNGTVVQERVPGQAEFEHDGRRYVLLPVQEKEGDELFFIIADRTSGKETYGGGRFLYAQPPHDGRVLLDFNKAVNPPCALNGHVVCPTAPPENRLDLPVRAGEKTYPRHG